MAFEQHIRWRHLRFFSLHLHMALFLMLIMKQLRLRIEVLAPPSHRTQRLAFRSHRLHRLRFLFVFFWSVVKVRARLRLDRRHVGRRYQCHILRLHLFHRFRRLHRQVLV